MATAVLGSGSYDSPWDRIKDKKHPGGDRWDSSNGSGWGTGGWDENGGWGSSSRGWGSGTGQPGEWGSSSGKDEGDWGLPGGAWGDGDSRSGSKTQPTLTDFWSGSAGGPESPSWKPSSLERDVKPEFASTTNHPLQPKDDSHTAWGTGTGNGVWAGTNSGGRGDGGETKNDAGVESNVKDNSSPLFSPVVPPTSLERSAWGAHATTSSSAEAQSNVKDDFSPLFSPVVPPSPERSAWGAHATTSSSTEAQSGLGGWQADSINNPAPDPSQQVVLASTSQPSPHVHEGSRAEAYPHSYFTFLADGSPEYRPYPTTYDIRAMWEANYTGQYSLDSMDFAASSDTIEESIDRHMERYYWDLRYKSELPHPSPYIQEMQNISERHRELLIGRLEHIDFMFSRVERKMRPIFGSKSEFQFRSSKDFQNQHDRDVKQTVYKALRLLYKEWHDSADYPSVLDWEGDHSMPYCDDHMTG